MPLLVLTVILAGLIRLYRIDILTSFQGDQGRDLLATAQIIINHHLRFLGPPSTFGPYSGPLYYYLLLPGIFLSHLSPVGPLLTAVIVNVLALVLLFFLCKRFFSQKVAVLTVFLFALSPLMVETGRLLLNAYFGLPFFIAALYILLSVVMPKSKPTGAKILLLGFLAGCLIQIHYSFAPFLIFCLLMPLACRTVPKLRYYLLFSGAFFVASLPQILFELTHGFLDVQLLLASLHSGKGMMGSLFPAISFFFSTVGYVFGWQNVGYGLVISIILVIGLRYILKKQNWQGRPALIWLLAYVLVFFALAALLRIRLEFPAYHYYMSIMPILIIFAALILVNVPKFIQLIVLMVFGIMVFLSLQLSRNNGFAMVANWNLVAQETVADRIAADTRGKTDWNVASLVDGDTQALPFRYLLTIRGAANFLGVDDYPRTKTLYVVSRGAEATLGQTNVWEIASLRPFQITASWSSANGVKIYRLERISP